MKTYIANIELTDSQMDYLDLLHKAHSESAGMCNILHFLEKKLGTVHSITIDVRKKVQEDSKLLFDAVNMHPEADIIKKLLAKEVK